MIMSLPPLAPVVGNRGSDHAVESLPARKRSLSGRPLVPVSDTPAQRRFSLNCSQKTAASRLPKRFVSLAIVSSETPLTARPAASRDVCPAALATAADDSTQELHKALSALAFDGVCSPEQVNTLRKEYGGSLKPLIPYLAPTFTGVKGLLLSIKEWMAVVDQYPLAVGNIPKELLRKTDAFYVRALCASNGSAKVVKLLPDDDELILRVKAFTCNPALLELLPVAMRTAEDCRKACIKQAEAMAHVPDAIRTEAFVQQLCERNPNCFSYLADGEKTKELALQVCTKIGSLLKDVPHPLRDETLYRAACLDCPSLIPTVPEAICTKVFCLGLVKERWWLFEHIPSDKMTAEMCEHACSHRPSLMHFVPVPQRTETLCRKVRAHKDYFWAADLLPRGMVSREDCRQACKEHGGYLANVPNELKNEELYPIASSNCMWRLRDIPVPDRTRAFCLKSGVGRDCEFSAVPDNHINLDFLFSVMGGKNDLALHTRAQKLLPEEDYTTFVCVSALYRTDTQLKLLTWPELPDRFRSRLIDFLTGQGEPLALHRLPQHPLTCVHNPLRFTLYNPFVSKLLLQAHMARHYRPACQTDGDAWLRYLEEQLPKYVDRALPPIDSALAKPLQTGHIEVKGGRTLQVKDGDTIYYYKFQRKKEPLKDLLREGLIHQFRAENPQGAWAKLASDLPTDPHFFQLDKSMWPKQTEQFEDVVAEQKEGEREWANVYRYTASADYSRYAHQQGSEVDGRWKKPEEGILTACYDMGLFASMGLMLTSMLPAMHNSDTGKSWQSLNDLFGNWHSVEVHPGTLGAWNGTATKHCDIGFGGLRDVGDYEQFGAIKSCFRKSYNDGSAQPVEIGQRLAVVSTLCDNVLAAILIRSRLRQQDSDYHYKLDRAMDATMRFIGDVCDHLLTGLAGKDKREKQTGITRLVLGVDKEYYDQWLHRAALEIVYWTACQPDPHSGKVGSLQTVNYDPTDGWATHMKKEHNPSATLYDPAEFRPEVREHSAADFFSNPNEEDNLGGHNEVFPFTTLVQGLTSLGGDILAHPQRLASPEADDTAMQND